MQKRISLIGLALAASGSVALADFTYEQTSKMTGGMMMGAMKVVGVFSKQAREPIRSTVIVKGDRMATVMPNQVQIIDLARETMTEVNLERKTFSVITFAEFAEALKALDEKIKNEKGDEVTDMSVKVKVDQPGDTRQVNGMSAKHAILRVEFEGTDKKSGQRSTFMTMITDMWLAPEVSGYGEVKSFHQRMAQKLNWAPGQSGFMSAVAPGSSKGMGEMVKEMSKLDGVPVLQIVKMGMGTPEQMEAAQKQQQQQPQGQQAQSEAEKPSVGGALSRGLGGRLGGLGRFGRGKKQEEQPESKPAQAEGQQQGGPSPYLMEMTSELTSFSSSADASKLEVPAGFKQVESETLKNLRRR